MPTDPRLIAQAPAMLKALQRLTHPMADDEDLRDALIVIARATGQPVPDEDYKPFWRCPDCGREYDDIDDGPCPSDDCPSRDNVGDDEDLRDALVVIARATGQPVPEED